MMPPEAQFLIERFELEPLAGEGGYFKRIFTYPGDEPRPMSAIYFLITPESCSRIHRIPKFEIYTFLCGNPAKMMRFYADSTVEEIVLGNPHDKSAVPSTVIQPNVWQGTRLLSDESGYAFFYVSVTPGFEDGDIEIYPEGFLDDYDLTREQATFAQTLL